MENEKFNDSIEITGDLYDEYEAYQLEAIQAEEADSKPPLPPLTEAAWDTMTEAAWEEVFQHKMIAWGEEAALDEGYWDE